MVYHVKYNPQTVKSITLMNIPVPNTEEQFPFLQIDTDSYIVGAEVQSGLNFNYSEGVHCIQIGKYCAFADNITFLVNLNHDYKSVLLGSPGFLTLHSASRTRRKGSVLIQNDVWIGHGATIMGGITIHNGAIIGAESVVTKDVPAYTMAAGNPARIIGYRFDEEQRRAMNAIGWWNWPLDSLAQRQEDFIRPVEDFIEKYGREAEEKWNQVIPAMEKGEKKTILFIADFEEPFSLWKKILKEYYAMNRPQTRLVLYICPPDAAKGCSKVLLEFLKDFEGQEAEMILKEGKQDDDLRSLFAAADYFVTTRNKNNILWTEYADHYDVKLLYGTDIPVFSFR
ncbi:CatB-related O-acetyltransferase [Clostridium sp. Marseille-P2415]|uniref:CatB-related O-acetyltransferase n=1 Tax=Clostridium sp. Marseille-P2415 TaxID=1805471 RepID=UPI0009887501|nr:CatB-related O-acetyltransferase [Clostridium sp. Marseille-P2415]